uniref:(northern house mosquito) hypothetical protein n=1 Tax=Culex pipiens TaxID=7175 RepID=A0A8D8CIW8_CULPI
MFIMRHAFGERGLLAFTLGRGAVARSLVVELVDSGDAFDGAVQHFLGKVVREVHPIAQVELLDVGLSLRHNVHASVQHAAGSISHVHAQIGVHRDRAAVKIVLVLRRSRCLALALVVQVQVGRLAVVLGGVRGLHHHSGHLLGDSRWVAHGSAGS